MISRLFRKPPVSPLGEEVLPDEVRSFLKGDASGEARACALRAEPPAESQAEPLIAIAASTLAQQGALIRQAERTAKVRAKVNAMRADLGRPPLDFDKLRAEAVERSNV